MILKTSRGERVKRELPGRIGRTVAALSLALTLGAAATACDSDADVASENISKDAENFKILRRIVFYNGITDKYILVVEGYCSVDPAKVGQLEVTCKTATKGVDGAKQDEFKKHYLGSGDNVTWFAEQIEAVNVSASHYKVIFKPETIIPDVEKR
jgi:hypothetical protein